MKKEEIINWEDRYEKGLLELMSDDFPKNAEMPRIEATRQYSKNFIRQALLLQRQEIAEKVRGMKKPILKHKFIKEIIPNATAQFETVYEESADYNQVLEDIIKIIEEEK
jgi:hypothetical protein